MTNETWKARAEKAKRERDEAIRALSEQSRLRGEAEGKLAALEMAGVVDGWKARAEVAEVRVKELDDALQDAAETLEWAARRLRDTCASGGDIAAVNLAANRAREARTALSCSEAAV